MSKGRRRTLRDRRRRVHVYVRVSVPELGALLRRYCADKAAQVLPEFHRIVDTEPGRLIVA